jgi:Bacterial SH3 domain
MKFITKSTLIGLFSLGAMLISSLPAMARPATTNTDANIRSSASVNSRALQVLAPGSSIEALNMAIGADGYTWIYIRFGSQEGWVRSDLVSYAPTNLLYGLLRGDRDDRINIRASASTSSDILHYGLAGDIVSVGNSTQGEDGSRWYWVTFPNQAAGWVRSDLLSIDD